MSHLPKTGSESQNAPVAANQPTGPVSKCQTKRVLEKRIHEKASELDQIIAEQIELGAEELNITTTQLSQRFAIVASITEVRAPSWWNGLMSDRAEAWKDEYDGPGKKFLQWVAKRIGEDDQYKELNDEQKAHYTAIAARKRIENKQAKTSKITRKKAIKGVIGRLNTLNEELQRLNRQTGVEFALFVTRGSLEDDLEPFYASSDKAAMFLQGNLKLPMKELMTLMDLSVIGGVGGLSTHIGGQKEAYRQAVRMKLNTSFCQTIKSLGHDTSKFRHIKYSRYIEIIETYKVVLRGYPLTLDGNITHPSDYPGGMKGLAHADGQLAAGAWGFEKISDAMYKEWKSRHDEAEANKQPLPSPPYIPVPGTEFKLATAKVRDTTTRKRMAKSVSKKDIQGGKRAKVATGSKKTTAKVKSKKASAKVKSRATIEDSDTLSPPPEGSSSSSDDSDDSDDSDVSDNDSE
ncbi:hypothetical protein FRC07_011324 [Ceratobasidium sp. 392]|nr:hypothetical protein FRC07_011324 [Ceratobasidium sp. 392]